MFSDNKLYAQDDTYNSDFFYSQLNRNQKDIYNALLRYSSPAVVTEIVPLSEPLTIPKVNGYQQTLSNEDKAQINKFIAAVTQPATQALVFDNPIFFWLETNYVCSCDVIYNTDSIVVNALKINIVQNHLFRNLKQATDLKNKVEEGIGGSFVKKGSSRYQTLFSIYSYLLDYVEYNSQNKYCHTPSGVFAEPYQAVCDGYAKAFKLLCDYYEIPCVLVGGTAYSKEGEYHMWCYVQMEDNLWYALDPTWDDIENNQSDYKYFLKGEKFFSSNHFPLKTLENEYAYLLVPELNQENYTAFPNLDLQKDMNIDIFDVVVSKQSVIDNKDILCTPKNLKNFIFKIRKET